ncbi:MAG: hypothetical protein FWD74_09425, partial [Actinomycetia bacterium]|nr:hypothetical protein [Actinomycetes bacterium]
LPTPDGGTTQVMTMHDGLMMVPALAPTMQGGQPDWSLAWSKLPLGTLQHTGAGLWLGVIGFVLVGVAAVFGPRRVAANKA